MPELLSLFIVPRYTGVLLFEYMKLKCVLWYLHPVRPHAFASCVVLGLDNLLFTCLLAISCDMAYDCVLSALDIRCL